MVFKISSLLSLVSVTITYKAWYQKVVFKISSLLLFVRVTINTDNNCRKVVLTYYIITSPKTAIGYSRQSFSWAETAKFTNTIYI